MKLDRRKQRFIELEPAKIKLARFQPRKSFDEYELRSLSDSIRTSGLLQPVAVRLTDDGYELIAGERRLRAAVLAGLESIPCVVHITDEKNAAVLSLTENIQRKNLSMFEEAEGIRRITAEYPITQTELSELLGLAQSTLSNKLRLLRLNPDQRQRITAARLSERHARALLALPAEMIDTALDKIIAESLTATEAEKFVDTIIHPPEKPSHPEVRLIIGDIRVFTNSLNRIIDTMRKAGFAATSRKSESEEFITYTVRIPKAPNVYTPNINAAK